MMAVSETPQGLADRLQANLGFASTQALRESSASLRANANSGTGHSDAARSSLLRLAGAFDVEVERRSRLAPPSGQAKSFLSRLRSFSPLAKYRELNGLFHESQRAQWAIDDRRAGSMAKPSETVDDLHA
jgi:hypothetical protein